MKKTYMQPATDVVKLISNHVLAGQSTLQINRGGDKVESVDDLLSREANSNGWSDDED